MGSGKGKEVPPGQDAKALGVGGFLRKFWFWPEINSQ